MNSLYQSLNQTRQPNLNQRIMEMASRDNRVASILNEMRTNNVDAKTLFYQKAKQMGIDPNTILSQIK